MRPQGGVEVVFMDGSRQLVEKRDMGLLPDDDVRAVVFETSRTGGYHGNVFTCSRADAKRLCSDKRTMGRNYMLC